MREDQALEPLHRDRFLLLLLGSTSSSASSSPEPVCCLQLLLSVWSRPGPSSSPTTARKANHATRHFFTTVAQDCLFHHKSFLPVIFVAQISARHCLHLCFVASLFLAILPLILPPYLPTQLLSASHALSNHQAAPTALKIPSWGEKYLVHRVKNQGTFHWVANKHSWTTSLDLEY